MAAIDEPREVRDEDRIDPAKVGAFLRAHVDGPCGEPVIRQFQGGASNLTFLVSCGEREFVLRKPPAGAKAKSAHDMLREARVMAALKPHYDPVPAVVATCDDESLLGSAFYVMERLRGIILRRDLPPGLGLDEEGVRRLGEAFVDRLVELHRIDATDPPIAALGKGEGYVARQLAGWIDRWRKAWTEGTDPCDDVVAWLESNRPPRDAATCVIHNDWRFDNVVLDAGDPLSITGVLDWEMATLGDPLMDLGGALAYWVEAGDEPAFRALRRQPTHVRGMPTRAEVVALYAARSGVAVDRFDFYEAFGLFRLMVIVQQIWRRVVLGQTGNPQFAGFGDAVRTIAGRCRRLVHAAGR